MLNETFSVIFKHREKRISKRNEFCLKEVEQKSIDNVRSRKEGGTTGRDVDDSGAGLLDMQRPPTDCQHSGSIWPRNQ